MLISITETGAESDSIHDLCLSLFDLNKCVEQNNFQHIYLRRVVSNGCDGSEKGDSWYFLSDLPITDKVMKKFWSEFYDEDYQELPV